MKRTHVYQSSVLRCPSAIGFTRHYLNFFRILQTFLGVSDFTLETPGQIVVENEDVKFTAKLRVTCAKVDCQVDKNNENIKLEIRSEHFTFPQAQLIRF